MNGGEEMKNALLLLAWICEVSEKWKEENSFVQVTNKLFRYFILETKIGFVIIEIISYLLLYMNIC